MTEVGYASDKEMQKERMFLSYFFSATSQEGNSLGAM